MKKFTLFLLAVLATSLSFAGVKPLGGARLPKVKNGTERVAKQRKAAKQALRKAPHHTLAGAITIDEQPEGKAVEMIASYGGLYYSWFGLLDATTDAGAITLIEGTDGNLYIKGLTPNLYDEELYWIKAEKTGEGEYVVKKQPAGYYKDYDEVDYLTVLKYEEDEEGGWYYEAENTDLKLTYKDGILAVADPETCYGVMYEDEGEWEWEGEVYWNLKAEPMTETYTTLPEGATTEELIMQFDDGAKSVQVAFVGNQVYVQSYENCQGWYVGTVSGNKVTFKNSQFLGIDSYYDSYQWLATCTVERVYDEDFDYYYWDPTMTDELVFDYDAESKTMTAPANTGFLINSSKSVIYYVESYINPRIFVFQEVAATPADPDITYFYPYHEIYENAELDFSIPLTDNKGKYITPDKLSYRLYVDDELFTFDGEEYETFDGQLTELPYGFSDGTYIGSTYLRIFFDPAKNIGLQSIYRGAGVENVSNIVYYDIENGEIYKVDKNGSIVDGLINRIDKSCKTAGTYDLTGRRAGNNARGLLLKTVTLSDGSLKTIKVVK